METSNKVDPIKIVIGGWGSYNERNERSLGSSWLTLNDYDSWEEIEEELKKQGFELDGIDQELFVQDVDCWFHIESMGIHPKELFELLYKSGVLESQYLLEVADAYIQVRGFNDWKWRVTKRGSYWAGGINIYNNMEWADYGYNYAIGCYDFDTIQAVYNYIDWDEFGKDMGDQYAHQFDNGIIEID